MIQQRSELNLFIIILPTCLMLLTLSILGCASAKEEPDFVIKGVANDAKTGKPIEGATISDGEYGPEPHKGTTTDSKGNYSYKTWYEEHSIVAEAPGYKPQNHLLTTSIIGKKDKAIINFELTPK